jgi:hypothetical protein
MSCNVIAFASRQPLPKMTDGPAAVQKVASLFPGHTIDIALTVARIPRKVAAGLMGLSESYLSRCLRSQGRIDMNDLWRIHPTTVGAKKADLFWAALIEQVRLEHVIGEDERDHADTAAGA